MGGYFGVRKAFSGVAVEIGLPWQLPAVLRPFLRSLHTGFPVEERSMDDPKRSRFREGGQNPGCNVIPLSPDLTASIKVNSADPQTRSDPCLTIPELGIVSD